MTQPLSSRRRELAAFWLTTKFASLESAWQGEQGKAHREMLTSGVRDEPLAPDEQKLLALIRDGVRRGWGDPAMAGHVLAGMLYFRPFQLNLPADLTTVPAWLANDLLRYLLETPPFFRELGDCDKHATHIAAIIAHVYKRLRKNPVEQFWLQLASTVALKANLTPLYFSSINMAPVAIHRGDIAELVLRAAGHAIDYQFPPRDPIRRIRLGILLVGVRESYSTLAITPIFEHLDRNRFEVVLCLVQPNDDPLERYYRRRADRVIDMPINELRPLVAALREQDFDLLFYTPNVGAGNSLWSKAAAHRLARIAFTDFATPVTTGIANVDYFISGQMSELPNAQANYRETLELIPGPGFCIDNTPSLKTPSQSLDRAALSLAADAVVFASGANFFKLIPELLASWMQILLAVPKSVLMLYPFGRTWSEQYPAATFLRHLHEFARKQGIDPARVIVLANLPRRADVKVMLAAVADVYLDSFPHSGSHSLLDALEVGVPAATLLGTTLRGRHGAAMLLDMQMEDIVPTTVSAYIDLAVRLGTDRAFRDATAARTTRSLAQCPRFINPRAHAQALSSAYVKWMRKWDNDHSSR